MLLLKCISCAFVISILILTRQSDSGQLETEETVVSFGGGNIDDNILKFYKYLHSLGLLRTKPLAIESGKSLSDTVISEKYLFRYYPTGFDAFLWELNKTNSGLQLFQKDGQARLRYATNITILVPFVDFQPYEFITPLDLHTLNLAQAVHKHNLIAQYKDTQSLLSKLENKRKQLNQLNPNLPPNFPLLRDKGENKFSSRRLSSSRLSAEAAATDGKWKLATGNRRFH